MTSIVVLLPVLTCLLFSWSSSVHRSGDRSFSGGSCGWQQDLGKVALVNAPDQGVTPLVRAFGGRSRLGGRDLGLSPGLLWSGLAGTNLLGGLPLGLGVNWGWGA